jgi:D-3-phosphoglycerate dehydrogenase
MNSPKTVAPELRIITQLPFSPEQVERLKKIGATYFATDNPASRGDTAEIIKRVAQAHSIIISISTPITKSVMDACPQLKLIQTFSTGTDNVDLEAARAKGIRVLNVPDFSTESVAEKTLALMLFLANRLVEANQDAKNGGWNYTKFQGIELLAKNLLLVGKGRIALRVAELARAFGMNVDFTDSKTSREELRAKLATADFISLHCPYSPQTHHLMGTAEFRACKKTAILINNSRGGVVDESALLAVLKEDHLRAVSLDVFEKEPPPADHPLLHHAKVFVTPHFTWNTEEARQRLSETAIKNLELSASGQKLQNVVI